MTEKQYYTRIRKYQKKLINGFEHYFETNESITQWYVNLGYAIPLIGLIAEHDNFHIAVGDMVSAMDELYDDYYLKGQGVTIGSITEVAKKWRC